jgi:hypothetical protein
MAAIATSYGLLVPSDYPNPALQYQQAAKS